MKWQHEEEKGLDEAVIAGRQSRHFWYTSNIFIKTIRGTQCTEIFFFHIFRGAEDQAQGLTHYSSYFNIKSNPQS